jgi:hypothetical protein
MTLRTLLGVMLCTLPLACAEVALTPPPDHDLRFTRQHTPTPEAARDCARCHGPDPCLRCHRTQRPLDHDPAFSRFEHGFAAQHAPDRCAQCHSPSSCAHCH